ncbi:lytic transglycosylase domain-containing protein [Pelosinus propionicus]|uniref:Soluble lytic murein transglycosylase n=1 Tax=Pelosinus propionicus DSM 13327 TaxID=1123291 RepID=A0A1I4MW60_9FIRM|nr:lytic transglycosylase domain-containing protein [Pelosinus propionicus]SFM07554.1 soluble lytic murein transglycosylase [Pelosinus propionicus DSM 13327]
MRILTRMKILVRNIIILAIIAYGIYNTDWFQKKYIYPFPYQDIVYQYALERELDPFLVAGVIRTESKFDAKALSPKGALGLMQMMPETAKWVAEQMEKHDFATMQLENPEINISMGTWYLASLKKEFKGNEVLMLAAYNGGRGNVKQWMGQYSWDMSFRDSKKIPFGETKKYVDRVLESKKRYQELYGR